MSPRPYEKVPMANPPGRPPDDSPLPPRNPMRPKPGRNRRPHHTRHSYDNSTNPDISAYPANVPKKRSPPNRQSQRSTLPPANRRKTRTPDPDPWYLTKSQLSKIKLLHHFPRHEELLSKHFTCSLRGPLRSRRRVLKKLLSPATHLTAA